MSHSNIQEYTDTEISREMNRRNEQKRVAAIPKKVKDINFDNLARHCELLIEKLAQDSYYKRTHDAEHEIFVAAIEAVFGDVWNWIYARLKD